MIVVVLVIGVWLGWPASQLTKLSARRWRRFRRPGDRFFTTGSGRTASGWRGESPLHRDGLWRTARADHFGNVAEVCGGYHPGEAVMAQVEKLDRLESLDLAYGPMTDALLAHLPRINELLTVE